MTRIPPLKHSLTPKTILHGTCQRKPIKTGIPDFDDNPGLTIVGKKKAKKPQIEPYYKFPGVDGFCS
jgi:hypothetical protein